MNKKKSKALAFLLAASLLVPSVNGIVSAAELNNVKSTDKVVASQDVTNPDGRDTSTQNPIAQNVAKIGNKEYATLTEAINDTTTTEGATIELLSDVTEDITVNKNITIDGKNKYTITGLTTLKNGKLKNVTIQPNPNNEKGSVLVIGSTEETHITMDVVTVNYSVTKRDGTSACTLSGNNANITIQNCLFTNNPNNAGTIDVLEWSFGLSMGVQGDKGSFNFINNEFNGAFRTMLPSINGKVTIDNNVFVNTVQSVFPGTTDGAKKEATCITTGYTENDNFTITNNTFDNAGAFLFQKTANVTKNIFKGEKFIHYIQLKGYAGGDLDLTDNTFEMGNNAVCSMDTTSAEILLPVGEMAYNYWAWDSLEELSDPNKANLVNYKYSFQNNKNRVYYPASEKALKAFVNPKPDAPIIGVNNNEKLVISDNITIGAETALDILKDKNITIEVPSGITLTLDSTDAMNITGTLNLIGDGEVIINKGAELNVGKTGKLNLETTVENNGKIKNDGEITVDLGNGSMTGNKIEGNGKVDYEYPPYYPSKPSEPTYTHEEIIGSDRYDTAAKIADKLGSYDNVVLVNASSTMSDGLSASGLAGKENGAILLTKKDSIPKVTMDRIKKVKKVYIIGGESAISAKVANEITAAGIKVERLGGKTRVETSEIVAKKLGNYSNAFVVNGFKGEADAMSASAVAARYGAPILLTNGKTSTHAKKSNVEYYVIGGNNVVDKSIATKYDAEVLAGKDRYATNREVIDEFYSGSDKLYLANGDKLVDALTASPLAKNHGIVLVNKKSDKSILKDKNTVQVGGMDFEIEFEK